VRGSINELGEPRRIAPAGQPMEPPRYSVAVPYEIQRAESGRVSESYLLTCDSRRFYVGALTADVLDGLRARRPLADIADDLRKRCGGITFERVRGVVESRLVPLGLVVVEGEQAVSVPPKQRRYVKATTTLIPPHLLESMVSPLKPLSSPVASVVLSTLAVLMYAPYVARFGVKALIPWTYVQTIGGFHLADFVILYTLLVGSILCHELGHATAAARYGVRLGELGFGFYLLFPVFFADVSESWKVGKYKRLAINLGGVYFQSLANAALMAAALFSGSEIVRYAVLVNAFGIVYALNPFLRFDGYWVVSDLFEVHGLRAQSLQFGRDLLHARWKERFRLVLANAFLVWYGIFCAAFFALLGYVYVRLLIRIITVPTSLAGGIAHWLLLAYIVIKAVVPAVRKRMNGSSAS
jgi:putative peptide zinc metalloprotease protein